MEQQGLEIILVQRKTWVETRKLEIRFAPKCQLTCGTFNSGCLLQTKLRKFSNCASCFWEETGVKRNFWPIFVCQVFCFSE